MDYSTIAAISTPDGPGGIGIIRLSGAESLPIAASIFRHPSGRKSLIDELESHRLYYGSIVDNQGLVLDEVLLAVMKSPRSYTREDVIEIQSHSGRAVLHGILSLVLEKGAVPAAPGEFTKRAFLNGRIDLTQAEAVIDIIHAETSASLQIAAMQLKGEIGRMISAVRNQLITMLAEIEASIDFSDEIEDDEPDFQHNVSALQSAVIQPINELINCHKRIGFIRKGLKAAIVGKPNVGKSSLMNALVKRERAIVTDIPGTTRDIIEEPLDIHGIPVIIADTAGLRNTDHPVEKIGVEKTAEYIRDIDMVLFVIDINQPLSQEDYRIYDSISGKPFIIVLNKTDLTAGNHAVNIPLEWQKSSYISISALYRRGIDELCAMINTMALNKDLETQHSMSKFTAVPNLRHRRALEKCLSSVLTVCDGLRMPETPAALLAVDMREAINALDEITGDRIGETVLDSIFDRFCIGK